MGSYDVATPDQVRFIADNLSRHKQFVLGTSDENGNPWVVCLNMTYDDNYGIIWQSHRTTEHSKHIARHPKVAICVFSESADLGDFGFYALATAHEVQEATELNRLLAIRFGSKAQPIPPAQDFLGSADNRLYYAELEQAWMNDDSHVKAEVNLNDLRSIVHGN